MAVLTVPSRGLSRPCLEPRWAPYSPQHLRLNNRKPLASTNAGANGALSSPISLTSKGHGAADPSLVQMMEDVAKGQMTPQEAASLLYDQAAGFKSLSDFAHLDAWKAARTGFPEVVWGPGKTPAQIAAIMSRLAQSEALVLATRITPEVFEQVKELEPSVQYNELARILTLRNSTGRKQPRLPGTVAVLSEGTADAGVAEEAKVTAEAMGCYAFRLLDVGVAGLQRVLKNLPAVRAADVVVVVSSMDGALPSVVAGLIEAPVIAVPTSIGYGAAFGGIAPLLGALTTSSPGVTTVNIDNGFGAGMTAARILQVANKLSKAAQLRAAMQAQATAAPSSSAQ